jgi:hypothetical protein
MAAISGGNTITLGDSVLQVGHATGLALSSMVASVLNSPCSRHL